MYFVISSTYIDMLPVRDACCEYLDKHMDENNSLGIQTFAEMHACQHLQDKARVYSLKNFVEVSNSVCIRYGISNL